MRKIQARSYIQWRHVPFDHNPADLGSRGGKVEDSSGLWWNGPSWLSESKDWPEDITVSATAETESEAKIMKDVLGVAVQHQDELGEFIQKWDYWKVIRITAWLSRFIHNSRAVKHSERIKGPLTTKEIEEQNLFGINECKRSTKSQVNFERINYGTFPL